MSQMQEKNLPAQGLPRKRHDQLALLTQALNARVITSPFVR